MSITSDIDASGIAEIVVDHPPVNALPVRLWFELASTLRAAGYATSAFTEDGYLAASAGFARGFDSWVERSGTSVAQGEAAATFRDAEAWLTHPPPSPWFLFLHTYQVHDPYEPPPGYVELLGVADDAVGAGHRDAVFDG